MVAPLEGFPSADQVAIAIVAASRIIGVHPEDVLLDQPGKGPHPVSRARWLSTAALIGCFPDADPNALGKLVGLPGAWHVQNYRAEWWKDEFVAEVEDAILNS